MHVTANFSLEEFRCHDGSDYPVNGTATDHGDWFNDRLLPLCQALEIIRNAGGGEAITITSGYRTLAYDQKLYDKSWKDGSVAPATSSQHPKGRAADIMHATLSPAALHNLILQLIVDGKLPMIGGCGIYPNFCHIDVRPKPASGHVAQWSGGRMSNIA